MNNSELDSILKKARVPERPKDFWDALPREIVRAANQERNPSRRAGRPAGLLWAWGLGVAALALIVTITVHHKPVSTVAVASHESTDVLQSANVVNETLALFPNRVRAIIEDAAGMRLVLSDHNDVPASAPLYVKICDGQHCSSMVTFSGQEIQFGNDKLTVLSDARGGIIVEGNQLLWSSTGVDDAARNLKIEAHSLSAAAM